MYSDPILGIGAFGISDPTLVKIAQCIRTEVHFQKPLHKKKKVDGIQVLLGAIGGGLWAKFESRGIRGRANKRESTGETRF